MRADGFNRRADLWLFMHHQVIEDDDVAGAECRRQDLFDVGEEAHIVDRTIKTAGARSPSTDNAAITVVVCQ